MAVKFNNILLKMILHTIYLFIFVKIVYSAKLTVPRILLPYNTGVPTNYTLEVIEGGCYKWSSNRYDLVSVTPMPAEHERATCTTRAIVSSVTRYPEHNNAIVLAEDEKSGQVLRCDVVIDSLYSIEVYTTTRVLFLEDAPEVFEVVAKNDQGDTFSSLSGVAFHWSLESESYGADAYGVVRFLKFADSVYSSTVDYWEKQNLHGSLILIEGSKTGTAKVIVRPLDPAYKHIDSYEVSLVIVANLILKPSHTYLLLGTKIKYHLELIKQGKAFPIPLPSDQYYLEVNDSSIANLNTETSTATALKYGSTNVVVRDRYVTGKEISYLPSALIHVSAPSYLTLSVSPGDKWSLEENKQYSVSVHVYDRSGHPIHITEDVRISIQFPTKYFDVTSKTVNGSIQEVQTLTSGTCKIVAQLIGTVSEDGEITKIQPTVSASTDVTIYKSISVIPPFTLLPWDPVTKPTYSIYLKATGGTGSFNWKSGDSNLGSVYSVYENEEPKARVSTFGQGTFSVLATDAHLPLFTGSAEISIQPIVDMQILPKEVEAEVNSSLILPLAMYGYLQDKSVKMFSNCSEVPIVVDIDETQKFSHDKDSKFPVQPSACQNVVLKCHVKGFNRIHVKYESKSISLKKTVVLGCYRKLRVVNPGNEVVISLGSSFDVIFEGGPIAWPRCTTHYVENSPQHPYTDISVLKSKSDAADFHKVHAYCKDYGAESFVLAVGNKLCDSNKYPAVNEVSYQVFCALPEALSLRPVLPSVEGRKCPATAENLIAIHSSHDLLLELIVKDSAGREFHNISSLSIRWYLSDDTLAQFALNEGVKALHVHTGMGHNRNKYYQELHPYGPQGNLRVTASIVGYKSSYVKDLDIEDKYFSAINTSLKFTLVEEPKVEPKRVSVFNSPSNKVYLNVSKGSGHFLIQSSNSNKADVVYKSSTGQIEITPLDTGMITISIVDLCLGIKQEAVSEIQIYGISAVVVDVLDKVQVGHFITATVEILNEENQQIPASVFGLMNLQPVSATPDIISMTMVSPPEANQYHASYKITGISLGHTTFRVVTNDKLFKGKQYASDSNTIQVFPPLKLSPSRIVLIVGASFQVLYSGGPQPQTNIEFSMDDQDTAIVSVSGIVEAKKIGKSILYARSVGHDKKGNAVVFSEDKAYVECISLKEIKIHSPLSRMLAGTEMPLYVMGVTEHEKPFTFGTASPGAKFKWTISNDKVASLQNLYAPVGLQENSENNFRVALKAHQDGIVTVHVEVTFPRESSLTFFGTPHILSGDIQIQVFKKLKLTNPEVKGDLILLSPNSQLKLECNGFEPSKLTFEILPLSSQKALISIDKEGHVVTSSKTESAILLVKAVELEVVQKLSVIVRVEKISYIMVRPTDTIQTRDWPLSTLPVGFTMKFAVTYHDNVGRQFDAVRSQIKFRASRHTLARVTFGSSNTTLTAQVVKPGYTVLKVWDMDLSISADYIRIVTGSAIDPSDVQLTVGDVICFGSPLLTKEGHGGSWSSSKPVLSIHPVSGGAVALSPGTTTITYTLRDGYSTSTEVIIHEAAYISIMPGAISYISNFPRSKPYKIPIMVQRNDTSRTSNLVGRNCSHATENSMPLPLVQAPFTCDLHFVGASVDISISDIFLVTSGFDIEKGVYFCSIEPVLKIPIAEVSTLDGQLSLSVQLYSMDHSSSLSQQHLLSFLPAFHVQQSDIIFTEFQLSAQVVVTATPAVQHCIVVVPSDQSILQVRSPVSNSIYPGNLAFIVEVQGRSNLWRAEHASLHLDISCHLTKQTIQIPVKVNRLDNSIDGGHCSALPMSPSSNIDWYFILSVSIAVLLCMVCFYIFRFLASSRRGIVTTQPVFLNSSNGSHAFTPGRMHYSPPPFSPRYSPSVEDIDNLSTPLRLCTLDTSPKSIRRRPGSPFQISN